MTRCVFLFPFLLLHYLAFAQHIPEVITSTGKTRALTPGELKELPSVNNLIWSGTNAKIKINDIAAAPILWFSPDEPNLGDYKKNGIPIPEEFPFETPSLKPVVYFKLLKIITPDEACLKEAFINNETNKADAELNLDKVTVFYIDYYFYYSFEVGLGSHPHDLESVVMKVLVNRDITGQLYELRVEEVIGRAHGLYWYNNIHTTEYFTKFPMTILVEEGKHASCPDANGDGVYTPSFDVNNRINDAWGVRDIIRSGKLYTGSYQTWMFKYREPETIISPPLPDNSPLYNLFANDKRNLREKTVYELRPFPENYYRTPDKHLIALLKSKKPVLWPEVDYTHQEQENIHAIEEDKQKKSFTVAYRKDAGGNFAIYAPLLLLRNVSAPMTGGWFVNRFYLGAGDLITDVQYSSTIVTSYNATIFGHMVMHISSASRWFDTYLGAGYELNDDNPDKGKNNYKINFAAEYGFKLRVNAKLKPLFKTPRFLGVRVGYKVRGFYPTIQSGLILEIGAGLW